jgi:hypothetical protein
VQSGGPDNEVVIFLWQEQPDRGKTEAGSKDPQGIEQEIGSFLDHQATAIGRLTAARFKPGCDLLYSPDELAVSYGFTRAKTVQRDVAGPHLGLLTNQTNNIHKAFRLISQG